VTERTIAYSRIKIASGIEKKSRLTHRRIASAGGIIQERRRAGSCIFISDIEKKHSSANTCIEFSRGISFKRI
jgi:hypothetical protein